ncbi:MAG: Ig-like domain-containing protein [Candidatus Bathyarchaeota archaeon]|nr:Ig-like domain-containing protein [Candidatus Bathyarchaeota archaeon]
MKKPGVHYLIMQKRPITLLSFTVLWLILSLVPISCYAQNYEYSYNLGRNGDSVILNLSITPSLYEYYQEKPHISTPDRFASFVTPYALAQVAEDIRSIFNAPEDYANGVLMLVHQIPYQIVNESKYPVETLIENRGDCDLFSYIAASLIKAQSLEVVLFYYQQESHMNIGVSLSTPPDDARTAISYVDHDGTRYYMAECTGGNPENGWRVGECPPELQGAQVTVIELDNSEQTAPGQVYSSFDSLVPSSITLSSTPKFIIEGSSVTLQGQVTIPNPSGSVTLFLATQDDWSVIDTTSISPEGIFTFSWSPMIWGQTLMRASWAGDALYAGAESAIISVFVIPKIVILAGIGIIVLVALYAIVALKTRNRHDTALESYSYM